TGGAPGSWIAGRIPETGGTLDTLFRAQTSIPYHFTTRAGLNQVVFALFNASAANPRVVSLDLDSRDTTTLIESGYSPTLSASGMLFFARNEGSLFTVPLDGAGRIAGSSIPVLDSLAESSPAPRYDISPSGTLVYVAGQMIGGSAASYALGLDSLNGGHERIPLPPSDHWDAKISPDGRRVAYIRNDHLWTYDLDLGTHTQLTHTGARHHNPAWSLDGTRIAFGADTGQTSVEVYVAQADGSGRIEHFGGTPGDDYPAQWLGDTAVLVYTQGLHGQNIFLVRKGGAEVTPVLVADWVERSPRVSHDGRWLAYVSNESGRNEIYVRTWPGLANKVQVTSGQDQVTINSFPLWANDDRTLYFRQGSQLVAATLQLRGDSLRVTARRTLREDQRGLLQDIHPDGRRLLVLAEVERPRATGPNVPNRAVVITNWLSQLGQRSAGGGPSK
ncbi:MAG TPA: DPP IV N-terminal domain-containing protein, partial [Gemmatimonadaceae bacterium]